MANSVANKMMDDTSFLLTSLLPTLEFVLDVPKHLICDRCEQAAIRPWRARCNHLFCCRCLNEIMRGLQKCPLDGISTILGEIMLEKDTDEAVRKLLVRCLYLKQGCGGVIVLGKLMEHLNVCNFLPVYCPRECGLTISRKDIVQHLVTSCPGSTSQLKDDKPGKRWPSVHSLLKRNSSYPNFSKDIPINKSNGNELTLMELNCQFQQMTKNVNQLLVELKEQAVKPLFDRDVNGCKQMKGFYTGNSVVPEDNQSNNESFDENETSRVQTSSIPPQIQEKSTDVMSTIVEMLQVLTVRVHHLDVKMATKEYVEASTASIFDRMDTMLSSLRLCNNKLETLEAGQNTIQKSYHEVTENLNRNKQDLDVTIRHLEDFNKKLDTQHDIWLNMIGDARQPWRDLDTGQGQLIWKITDYSHKKLRAVRGEEAEIYSPSFFTHHYGYKLCLRAYLNGYCDGVGTHLSIYVCLMKGPFDDTLSWPFRGKFTFSVLDQMNHEKKEHFLISVDPKKMGNFTKWCQKPEMERNVGFGLPEFISHKVLENDDNGYLQRDTIYLKIVIDSVKESSMHRAAKRLSRDFTN